MIKTFVQNIFYRRSGKLQLFSFFALNLIDLLLRRVHSTEILKNKLVKKAHSESMVNSRFIHVFIFLDNLVGYTTINNNSTKNLINTLKVLMIRNLKLLGILFIRFFKNYLDKYTIFHAKTSVRTNVYCIYHLLWYFRMVFQLIELTARNTTFWYEISVNYLTSFS